MRSLPEIPRALPYLKRLVLSTLAVEVTLTNSNLFVRPSPRESDLWKVISSAGSSIAESYEAGVWTPLTEPEEHALLAVKAELAVLVSARQSQPLRMSLNGLLSSVRQICFYLGQSYHEFHQSAGPELLRSMLGEDAPRSAIAAAEDLERSLIFSSSGDPAAVPKSSSAETTAMTVVLGVRRFTSYLASGEAADAAMSALKALRSRGDFGNLDPSEMSTAQSWISTPLFREFSQVHRGLENIERGIKEAGCRADPN